LSELNSLVSLFTDQQRKLAESTGFRSFSKEMHPLEFDKQFTAWLMPKVDTMSRSFGVSIGKRLMLFQEDVAKVFAIPCSGKEVWDATLDKSEAMRKKVQDTIGMDDVIKSPFLAAARTIRSLVNKEMSAEEETSFKVAFVVFVIGLLCDSGNPGELESVNFWPALKDPTIVHKFNWSSYVLESVFSACASARMATRTNRVFMPPAGTAMFLQVSPSFSNFSTVFLQSTPDFCCNSFDSILLQIFYLDNMDYGDCSLPKSILPRIELYDRRTLSKQIMAETIGLKGQTPCRQFGAGKVSKKKCILISSQLSHPVFSLHTPIIRCFFFKSTQLFEMNKT
jgi:hypothetical protein